MSDQDEKQRIHRQFLYSGLFLLSTPFLYISFTLTDPIGLVGEKQELPSETILYIALGEFFKILLVLWLYPTKDLLNPYSETFGTGLTVLGTGSGEPGDNQSLFRLPLLRKEKPLIVSSLAGQFLEVLKGICHFVLSLLLCHAILVLFGAPVIQDWLLTLQFSFILVCWLFFPLCLVFRPASILTELFYISLWDYQCNLLVVTKWRFLTACIGTWMGAIAMPLDWDRPWQKWPLPCLFSATAALVIFNFIIFFQLLNSLYGNRLRKTLFPKKINKVKFF